jgi:hypothetical protein
MPQCAREHPHCCTYRVSCWPATCPQIINGALHESRMCFKNGLVPRLQWFAAHDQTAVSAHAQTGPRCELLPEP